MALVDRLMQLEARGFDACIPSEDRITVGCSQCAALVINGVAAHESGCPHETHECKCCNARVPGRVVWCDDCHPARFECGMAEGEDGA